MDNYMKNYDDDDMNIIKLSTGKKNTTQNRLRSKVVWTSIVMIILPILGHLGLYEKINVTEDSVKAIIDGILGILILVGVLNDPTNSKGF